MYYMIEAALNFFLKHYFFFFFTKITSTAKLKRFQKLLTTSVISLIRINYWVRLRLKFNLKRINTDQVVIKPTGLRR